MEFNFKASDVTKHSAAHVMAAAVKRLFPQVRIGVGPVTKTGFYYDFEIDKVITNEDLVLIEKNCQQIIQENIPFSRVTMPKEEAQNMLLQIGQIYKAELLKAIPDAQVSFYKLGEEFIDLCRGPHVKSTNQLGIIKLTSVEKVFWNEDPARPEMYRIAGVIFQNIVEYNEYIAAIKTQSQRNYLHSMFKFGLALPTKDKKLHLTEVGSSFVNAIKKKITESFQDFKPSALLTNGISTSEAFLLMLDNFNRINRSYKNLPLVFFADGLGQNKVQNKKTENISFSVPKIIYTLFAPGNNFLTVNGDIIERSIDLSKFLSSDDVNVELRCAELESPFVKTVSSLLERKIVSHNKILAKSVGSNVEISFKTTDSVGKTWELITIILRNDVEAKFKTESNQFSKTAITEIVCHIDHVCAYLIEEKGMDLPFELHPEQVTIIPKTSAQNEFAKDAAKKLESVGIRFRIDNRAHSFKYKLFYSAKHKVEFVFVIGNKEEINKAVSVRHNNLEVGLVSIDEIYEFILKNKEKNS